MTTTATYTSRRGPGRLHRLIDQALLTALLVLSPIAVILVGAELTGPASSVGQALGPGLLAAVPASYLATSWAVRRTLRLRHHPRVLARVRRPPLRPVEPPAAGAPAPRPPRRPGTPPAP